MKIVIIGGGIAGLACGILLNNAGFEVSVNERESDVPIRGNAFLMHADGIGVMKSFADKKILNKIPGKSIDSFHLMTEDEKDLKLQKLEPWQCIKRKDLIQFLYSLFPNNCLKSGRAFSHFLYDGERVIAAVFQNGAVEYGDVFIGADGANSAVRQTLFGPTTYLNQEVKEIVGVLHNPILAKSKGSFFTKYISQKAGISFGFIPTTDEEIVWFMQFDSSVFPLKDESPESIKELCFSTLKDFPPIVHQVIKLNDFNSTYLWNARDFETLPSFHINNVVLVGDAAHLALPFTSAGTTNALIDAKVLTEKLLDEKDAESAFTSYYNERIDAIKEHLFLGRDLKVKFCDPARNDQDEIKIPLIENTLTGKKLGPKFKKVHLLYFTDPVCSTCWTIQPQLRKLKLEYDHYLEIEYCMGGLLPSWENYNRGGIKTPEDAFDYWQKIAQQQEMPIIPDIWKTNPLESSFPPSIAFKAAQMQDIDKAIIFLRKINELLFIENKDIIDNVLLRQAAFESGLDAAKIVRDMQGKAKILFELDLQLAEELKISVLPTFIFTDKYNHSKVIQGHQTFENFENALLEFIPDAQKTPINRKYNKIFKKYPTLTTAEFGFLINKNKEEAIAVLNGLKQKGIISRYGMRNDDIIWMLNQ